MPRSWTSSPELHLDVDVAAPRGRRAAVEQALRDAIRGGRLVPGTVLPSTRALAVDLGLARGTVVEAYAQLVAEGWLDTRAGAETVVADAAVPVSVPVPRAPRPSAIKVDFRPGMLDLAVSFPRVEWLRAVRAVLHSAPDSAFDYADPRGRPELRGALAAYLGRARGVVAAPRNVVVTTGFAHGLSVLTAALSATGVRAVAMENPCLPNHREIVVRSGLEAVAVPVDEGGLRADGAVLAGVGAVLVTPAHQYPMGVTLAPHRRVALAAWARETAGVVIEDDYDGEFRYDRQPVGAMQALDPDHVVYAGTASKTLAPGIRIAWFVLPPRLVEPVVEVLRVGGATPPALEQLALAHLLESGSVDRQLRRLRHGYRARRDQLVAMLAQSVPGMTPTGIAAGLHLLVDLGRRGPSEADVKAAADERGMALGYLGSHWHPGRGGRRRLGVIVGYSRPPAASYGRALKSLAAVLGAKTAG